MDELPSESGPVENPDLASAAPDAAAEAARERVAEAAAEAARAQMAQVRRDEAKAKRSDGHFVRAMLRFLQSRASGNARDDAYLEILVQLLDRNVPSMFLLAAVSLLDDEAASEFRELLEVHGDDVRALAAHVETKLVHVPASIPDAGRVFHWALLLILAVDALDAEARLRLTVENREADVWVRDLLQETLLLTVPVPNPQARVDSATLAAKLLAFLHQRPLPTPSP